MTIPWKNPPKFVSEPFEEHDEEYEYPYKTTLRCPQGG